MGVNRNCMLITDGKHDLLTNFPSTEQKQMQLSLSRRVREVAGDVS